jgi:methionyl aminopeptidase
MADPYRNTFQIFSEKEIASLRKGGKILHDCLRHVARLVHPGITTKELDLAAEAFIREAGAKPAFKGYHGYPATLCTSINDVCVHGIPGTQVLAEGEIIALDCGVLLDGLYTDAALTVPVGEIDAGTKNLLHATEEALQAGLRKVRAGAHTGDISATIHEILLLHGFDSVRALTGHGLGDTLHQFPDIPNFGTAGKGPILPAGTIIAIEPISTVGSTDVVQDDDGWTLRTADGSLSAHFEHTVLVTDSGCEVLT